MPPRHTRHQGCACHQGTLITKAVYVTKAVHVTKTVHVTKAVYVTKTEQVMFDPRPGVLVSTVWFGIVSLDGMA